MPTEAAAAPEETSRTDDITSVLESMEAKEETASASTAETTPKTEEKETGTEGAAGAGGDPVPGTEDDKAGAEATTSEDKPVKGEDPGNTTDTDLKDTDTDTDSKAPIGWGVGAKEKWKDIPKEVQEQISAREAEISRTIAGTGEARKTQKFLADLSNSYRSVMAADGYNSPAEAIQGLMQTVSELRMGSPSQRAGKMANLINHYGVDIDMLDQALAGAGPVQGQSTGAGAGNIELERMLDQRMAPMNDMLAKMQGQQTTDTNARAAAVMEDIKSFAEKNEFMPHVREDMALMFDLAKGQGRDLTLQEAYTRACQLNPEVSKVIGDRKAATDLADAGKKTAAKKNAASSVAGKSGGTGAGGKEKLTLHDELSSLWDEMSN